MDTEEEYEVEKILKKRVKKDKLEYFVKWKNFDETSWEPLANLLNVRDMIDEFERKQVCVSCRGKVFCIDFYILDTRRGFSDN